MYLEYHELLKKVKKAEKNYNEALEKRSELILSVMPSSIKPKEIITLGNTPPDTNLINYASEIDEVDKLINQSRNVRDMLNYELKKKLIKMKEEGDIYDKIYIFKWIEGRKPRHFNKLIGFSLSRTYDYIAEMKEKLYKNTKSEKIGKN